MVAKRTREEVERELQEWNQLSSIWLTLMVVGDQLGTALSSIREGVEDVTVKRTPILSELLRSSLKNGRALQASIEKLQQKAITAEEISNAIAKRVDKLPMDHRTVLELRYRYGFTEIEVCQRMKLPYKRVQKLHNQGIALLSTMD